MSRWKGYYRIEDTYCVLQPAVPRNAQIEMLVPPPQQLKDHYLQRKPLILFRDILAGEYARQCFRGRYRALVLLSEVSQVGSCV